MLTRDGWWPFCSDNCPGDSISQGNLLGHFILLRNNWNLIHRCCFKVSQQFQFQCNTSLLPMTIVLFFCIVYFEDNAGLISQFFGKLKLWNYNLDTNKVTDNSYKNFHMKFKVNKLIIATKMNTITSKFDKMLLSE